MTKGRSTKLWITLLDPEIWNGEPRLVQVWRLYKDLPGSGPNWSEPCQLGTDPGKSLQSLVWWYRRGQTWGMRFKAWTIVLTLLAGTVVVSWEQAPRAAACSCVRAALSSASCGIEGIREGMVLTVFATKDGGDWRTNICDGTGPDAEQTAIAALGEPLPISQAPATTSPRPSQDPRGNEKGVNEGSGGPTAPPEPGADVQEPGGQGRGSMAIPLLIIATAGLIAGVTARLRE